MVLMLVHHKLCLMGEEEDQRLWWEPERSIVCREELCR